MTDLERNGSTKSGGCDSADTGVALTDALTRQLSQHEQVLDRVRSERYITKETIGADDSNDLDLTLSGKSLPPFGGGRPYPPMTPSREA
jgi:DHA1 family multidrug resistance protein-like MFS transporter